MRLLLRPANLLIIVSYLALSALPFLPRLAGQRMAQAIPILAFECGAWLCVWALGRRPARFHWLLLPAFLLLPTDLYLRCFYGTGISAHHLGILAETTPAEAIEFLGGWIWPSLAAMLAAGGWWCLCWRAASRTHDLDWSGRSRGGALLLLALLGGAWLYGREFGAQPVATAAAASRAKPSAWNALQFGPEAFGASRPFGLALSFYDFWKERQYLAALTARSAHFAFGAHPAKAATTPQIVVMVIGESSRYDRWGLNGYGRDTTPLLKTQSNLVSLGDVVTAVSATRLSVPLMMSRKPATQSLAPGFSEKSFISAYREAGFKTWWLSNQMSFGKFDTPVSVYASEADITRFLNAGGSGGESSFDQLVLPALQRALDDPAPKKLIVLHTLGSHWNYSHRYPPQYDRWRPSLRGVDSPSPTDLTLRTALNNSYDNSILYTDWFLSQVIAELAATGQLAAMMYVSDHGQTLYDGSCKLAFHGHNTQYEFHVPALVWYSDAWRTAYPAKLRQLRQQRNAPLSTENVFHSLLDLADIRYPDERLEWSIFSERWQPHTRYVDSYGWTDYDHATLRGDCREVIDKGTPLARQR